MKSLALSGLLLLIAASFSSAEEAETQPEAKTVVRTAEEFHLRAYSTIESVKGDDEKWTYRQRLYFVNDGTENIFFRSYGTDIWETETTGFGSARFLMNCSDGVDTRRPTKWYQWRGFFPGADKGIGVGHITIGSSIGPHEIYRAAEHNWNEEPSLTPLDSVLIFLKNKQGEDQISIHVVAARYLLRG